MKKSAKITTVAIIVLLVCLLAAVTQTNLKNANNTQEIELKDLEGNMQTIALNDKPSVLLFFTSWCPYCNEDAPKIVSMYQKYKSDINIYGINLINRENDPDDVREYIKKYNIDYPVLLDDGGNLYRKYKAPGFPTLIFLNKHGKEMNRIVGSTAIEIIERQFTNAIN